MSDDADTDQSGWQLVVAFTDQSPSFAHGFEVGELRERLNIGVGVIEVATHTENREVLRRLAEYFGWKVETVIAAEGWDHSTFTKIKPKAARDNPHGLHVV